NATDDRSGVAYTTYHLDGSPVRTYVNPIVVSADGVHTLTYHSADRAGNVELHKDATFQKDGTAPATAVAFSGTLNGSQFLTPILVTLSPTDALSVVASTRAVTVTLQLVNGTSPPDSIVYRSGGGAWTVYAQPFVAMGDGVHSLDFNATNGAGLNEATHHIAIRIDTTPPVSASTLSGSLGNDSWSVSVVTVFLSATDATSGVANLSYRIDG